MTQPDNHASESEYGEVEIASDAEATARASRSKPLVPAHLGSGALDATTEVKGVVEQATAAEIAEGAADLYMAPREFWFGGTAGQYPTPDGAGGGSWEDLPEGMGGAQTALHTDSTLAGDGTSGSALGVANNAIGHAQMADDAVGTD